MSPDNQVVIVSGGSRGLGRAIVQHLLDSGRKVATFSRKPSPFVESLKEEPRFLYQAIDATDTAEMCGIVRETKEKWGQVDALVNNAAIAYDGVLALMNEEHIERMLQVNLTAAIILAKECSRQMLLTGGGSIINVSSIIAQRGFSGLSVYAATKSGMIGFTKSLARELGPRKIRVNAIAPGYLETEMSESLSESQQQQIIRRTPLGRLGSVDDVAPVVEFLLNPASGYITGQVITVDGGSSL